MYDIKAYNLTNVKSYIIQPPLIFGLSGGEVFLNELQV